MRAILALAILTASAFAQQADPAMLKTDADFVNAITKSDKAAFEKLLDAEFTWTNAQGKTFTRAQVLQSIPNPLITATSASVRETKEKLPMEMKSYTYNDLGDVQVNQGRAHILRVYAKRAGVWKAITYQEIESLAAPPAVTPGAGKECENPCKSLQFTPKNETEKQVAAAYMKLETAAHARNADGFAPMVAEEFVAISSNSDRIQTKQSRIAQFKANKDAGVAPTPLLSAKMYPFSEAVLMISEHKPVQGNPLHVTRIWVKRGSGYVSLMSYQTAVKP